MRPEEKNTIINDLEERIKRYNHFYIADTSELNASDTGMLRRKCFEMQVELVVVKNTLLKKAFERFDSAFEEMYGLLVQSTSIMFCNVNNVPAKLIKDFRKDHGKPVLKGAYVEESIYLGDDKLDILTNLKSKSELIMDVMVLLQSPMRNLLSALKSEGNKLAGVLKTLADK
jgi:large subunit ribosomal protein L10